MLSILSRLGLPYCISPLVFFATCLGNPFSFIYSFCTLLKGECEIIFFFLVSTLRSSHTFITIACA